MAKHMKPEKAPYVIEACCDRDCWRRGDDFVRAAPDGAEYFAAVALLKRWKREEGEGLLERALRTSAALMGEPQGVYVWLFRMDGRRPLYSLRNSPGMRMVWRWSYCV